MLDKLGAVLDALTGQATAPAEVFAQGFRQTSRMFRRGPQLSRELLRSGLELLTADVGLAPRARRDIADVATRGRFQVADIDLAVSASAVISLGILLENQPDRDDASATDALTEFLLRGFGVPAPGPNPSLKARPAAPSPRPSTTGIPRRSERLHAINARIHHRVTEIANDPLGLPQTRPCVCPTTGDAAGVIFFVAQHVSSTGNYVSLGSYLVGASGEAAGH